MASSGGGLTDFYNMLQTGLVDCGMLWPESAATFNISEVAPYVLRTGLDAVNSKAVTVDKDYWDALPDEIKEVLQAVAVDYRGLPCGHGHGYHRRVRSGLCRHRRDDYRTFIGRYGRRAEGIPNIAQEWAASRNDSGADRTGMLETYFGKLEAAEPPMWVSAAAIVFLIYSGIYIPIALGTVSIISIWIMRDNFTLALNLLKVVVGGSAMVYSVAKIPLFTFLWADRVQGRTGP